MKEKILLHYKHKDYTIDFVTGQINYMITPINCGKDQLRWMQQITIKEPMWKQCRYLCSVLILYHVYIFTSK